MTVKIESIETTEVESADKQRRVAAKNDRPASQGHIVVAPAVQAQLVDVGPRTRKRWAMAMSAAPRPAPAPRARWLSTLGAGPAPSR